MPTNISSFPELLAFLNKHTDYERQQGGRTRDIFDLERMNEVLDRLARPELAYATAHVAGTKGKGSTSRFLASLLQSQGLKVGLFTSPHLERLTQRIEINGQEVSERGMIEAFQVVVNALEREHGGAPDITFFELLTLTAMVAFKQAQVDAAVFEVGLGGRLDSTNVINPLVSVITEIGLDHMKQLGDTIEEIAREKAGIIKPGVPVVCGASDQTAQRVINLTARDTEAPLLMFGKDYSVRWFERQGRGIRFTADVRDVRYEGITLPHPARYMAENAAHALCALEVMAAEPDLLPEGFIDRDRAIDALTRTEQPGRFEIFEGRPLLVIDSAHNELSLKAAMATAKAVANGPLVCVVGIAGDKDIEPCVHRIAEVADGVVFTRYYSPRETDPSVLLSLYEKFGGKGGSTEQHPEAALETALEQAGEAGLVLVTGSTYLAGALRPAAVEYSQP
ncbi:MAG: bifunctional folylpolyglutamate synthase/dihydrofolate synthase [Planctomycetes bacterium]|nr:bifunctional folylpolyglutamate synthase/dihydrofolate synthase [Planctomycetota bacterium]MCW8136556.1 bifunctional folylpolyglutamate synthase/dihydrofolate synthase [Planctomycetota bacterium]